MGDSLLAWRNWALDDGTTITSTNTYEADAPVTNLLTPQLKKLARVDGNSGPQCTIEFDEDKTVQLVSILNHNIPNGSNLSISLFNSSDVLIANIFDPDIWIPPNEGYMQHLHTIFPTAYTNVRKVELVTLWPHSFPFQAGGVWAGPCWQCAFDRGWKILPFESAQKVEGDAGSVRTQPQQRRRLLSFTMSDLSESDAMGIEGDGTRKLIPYANVLDAGMYACVSLPVIAVARMSSAERIHKTGVYGYFDTAPSPTNASGPGSADGSGAKFTMPAATVREAT